MQVLERVAALQHWSDEMRRTGRRIALVPTMGALHAGHLSLVQIARTRADRVVVSLFVNPAQFGPDEDFTRYPRTRERDLAALRGAGVDVAFTPSVSEIYPEGDATRVEVERVTEGMCGRGRPGHFRGVATVVARLFNAARPHLAVFGEKDYQQLVTIRRMTRDLLYGIEIVAGPTVREPDGLAMSSRNAYLSAEGRRQATVLQIALRELRERVRAGERDTRVLVETARKRIESEPLARVEYVEIRDAENLDSLRRVNRPAVAAVAVHIEGTRLIDNMLVEEL